MGRAGEYLDMVNECYDHGRIFACSRLDMAWTRVRNFAHELYKQRMSKNIEAETERRRAEFEAKLPLDSSLSFFDNYEIINCCPVFTLDALIARSPAELKLVSTGSGSGRHADPVAKVPLEPSRSLQVPKRYLSFKPVKPKITCYTFSHDDLVIACGMSDGVVSIWDATRGSLEKRLKGLHEFPIADVAFSKKDPSLLVSVDLDGYCVQWHLDTDPLQYRLTHCAPSWEGSSYVGKELAVPRLSGDSRYLGFPVYTYVESSSHHEPLTPNEPYSPKEQAQLVPTLYSILFIFETDAVTNDVTKKVDPLFVLPVRMYEPRIGVERLIDLLLFSRTSRCLLLTVYELAKGYLVLWPNFERGDVTSYKLDGTQGRFSDDDRFLVTWHSMLSSDDQFRDSNCYVWDQHKLESEGTSVNRSGWNHPRLEAVHQIVLGDPQHGTVHTCDFVRLRNSRGLVACCVSEEVSVIVWDLRTQTPLHVLKPDVHRDEISPGEMRRLSGNIKLLDRVHGLKCFSVFKSGQWAAIYVSSRRCGIVWNVSEGTQVMRIEIPEEKAENMSGMDFCFGNTATKMLFISKTRMLLWSPSVLRAFNPDDRPLYTLDVDDKDIDMGESLCKFSADGTSVGLMRFNAECMTIWRFQSQERFVLSRALPTQELSSRANRHQPAVYFQVEPARNRFCHFAISHDGTKFVTCMGDMSVLLWNLDTLQTCRRIAMLTSYYCPALDVCFSVDIRKRPMVVVCQDQGVLVWIDVQAEAIIHREVTEANRSCKFSANGKTAVLMSNLHHVKVWDLVTRRPVRTLHYSIPIVDAPENAFYPQLAPNAEFCLIGFNEDQTPIIATERTKPEDLPKCVWYPETTVLSEDGEWALLSGRVDDETDDLLFEEYKVPDFLQPDAPSRFPLLDFREDLELTSTRSSIPPLIKGGRKQTWRMVHLKGERSTKQIRLHFELGAAKFVALSCDGCKCAALNSRNQLVVWGTHFTYKSIIQQRYELMNLSEDTEREAVASKLYECGPSLVNHAYEKGMTIVMECVALKKQQMLQHVISWALESATKLSFQGRIKSVQRTDDEEIKPNIIDLAVDIRSPDTIEILLQAMIDGATSEATMASIFERSLVKISFKYPSLVLHLFKSHKMMKSLGVVNISEGYLRKRNDYLGVVTDSRLVASKDYIQNLWSQNEKEVMKNQPDRYHVCSVQAEAKVIPYPNVAKIGTEGILQPLLFNRVQHIIFGSDLVKGVINLKYETYARKLLSEDLYHYLLLLFVFTCTCLYAGQERRFKGGWAIFAIIILIIIGLGNLVRLLQQLHALWKERQYAGIMYYLGDYMKWIELMSYIVIDFFLPISVVSLKAGSEVVTSFMAVASVLLWVKMLYYAQAFRATGPMVVMIREIVKDIRWFLFLLVAFLVGFGVAFFVMLGDMNNTRDDDKNDGMTPTPPMMTMNDTNPFYFQNPAASLLTVFLLMLSDISDILDAVFDAPGLHPGTQVAAFLMIVTFLAAIAIVLLNLLIAIMGDSFDRVKNHEKTLYLQRRAQVIQDLEMGLPRKRKKKINDGIERYLHILVPNFQSTLEESDWEGRLVDIQRRMREELRDARDKGISDVLELKRDVKELKRLLLSLRGPLALHGASGSAETEIQEARRS